jgi:hypothetical protein
VALGPWLRIFEACPRKIVGHCTVPLSLPPRQQLFSCITSLKLIERKEVRRSKYREEEKSRRIGSNECPEVTLWKDVSRRKKWLMEEQE